MKTLALATWGNSRLAVVVDAVTGRRMDDSQEYVFTAGPAATGGVPAGYGAVR